MQKAIVLLQLHAQVEFANVQLIGIMKYIRIHAIGQNTLVVYVQLLINV